MPASLDGVRILDVTRVLSGPFCTMLLGDLGAEVIKVEPPEGDETRTWPPFYSNGESGYYFGLNRNKKGMVLNMKNPDGREIFMELARKSDIMVENFTPGVVDRLGIDYESVKKVNPRIIYCSISGFGQTGPYRLKKAYDPVVQALGGAMSVTGDPNGDPAKLGIPVGDLGGSFMAITAILAALYGREKTGVGEYIDISMLDAQVYMLLVSAAEFFADGTIPGRSGLEHPLRAPSKTFKTKNGYLTSSATSAKMFAALCRILGVEELIDDPRFHTNELRAQNRAELYAIIDKIMLTKTSEEWDRIFEEANLPSGIMKTVGQVFDDEQILERGMLRHIEYPEIGHLKMIGNPIKFINHPDDNMIRPPKLGEHTDDILRGLLGFEDEKLARMRQEKVVA